LDAGTRARWTDASAAIAMRADANRQLDELRTEVIAEIDVRASGIRRDATARIALGISSPRAVFWAAKTGHVGTIGSRI
jgi:hypothetical protein